MNVLIIGAGQGGLQAAKLLAEGGATVTVYEKDSYGGLCYDWIDDVEPTVFKELSFPLPEGFFRTANVAFLIPNSSKPIRVQQPDENREWSIERRRFSHMLVERAEKAGAKVIFDTSVDNLIIEDGRVAGIDIGGKKLYCDLVIDSSGAESKFRASLPKEFNVTPSPKKNEVFRVYRGFYNDVAGVEMPKDTKKIYLKHMGEDGISWCFVEPNRECNVLVGRIGELSQQTIDNSIAELKRDNPIIGDKLLRGGIVCTIPVRYPLSRMVANGYAAIGDAAFMTVPMIGSGISNCLRAGKILAETVLNANKTDVKSLWPYQYRYISEIGAEYAMVDKMKRMLLSAPAEDITFLFESGVIGDREMNSIATGEKLTLGFGQILDKIKRGWKKLGLLLSLVGAISTGEKAEAHARTIPKEFDEKVVTDWQKKLDAFFDN